MSGMYRAIRLNNSIEIRNSENRILDNITSKIEFNDFSPSKLVWLNDQYLLIYSQKNDLNSKQEIFVYNRITKELTTPDIK